MNLADQEIALKNIAEVVSSAMKTNVTTMSRKRKNVDGVKVN